MRGDTTNARYFYATGFNAITDTNVLSIALRLRVANPNTGTRYFASVGNSASAYNRDAYTLAVSSTEQCIFSIWNASAGSTNVTQTGNVSEGGWFTVCACNASSTSHTIITDGDISTKKHNTASRSVATIDSIGLGTRYGSSSSGNLLGGYIAWMAVWNAALSDNDALAVTGGAHPFLVNVDDLVAFVETDDGTGDLTDQVGGLTFNQVGSVTSSYGVGTPIGGPVIVPRFGGAAPAGQPFMKRAGGVPGMSTHPGVW